MNQARVRTESMAQRLSKKPLSEGFELWDKGYFLGAMRLFIFKAENCPPFQLGACLDAMGHLLARLEEGPDAAENFEFATEKYELIQQPLLAKLMRLKGLEAEKGPEEALNGVNTLIAEYDPKGTAVTSEDNKLRTAVARAYHFRAELLLAVHGEANAQQALEDANYAATIGWDRDHLAYYLIGSIQEQLGNLESVAAYEKAVSRNSNYLPAYEALTRVLGAVEGGTTHQIEILSKAIDLHPKSALICQKAFILADQDAEDEALAMLDSYIINPPHEEGDSLVSLAGVASASFLKAKAAIYADGERYQEALAVAEEALKHSAGDEEALQLIEDIKKASTAPPPAPAPTAAPKTSSRPAAESSTPTSNSSPPRAREEGSGSSDKPYTPTKHEVETLRQERDRIKADLQANYGSQLDQLLKEHKESKGAKGTPTEEREKYLQSILDNRTPLRKQVRSMQEESISRLIEHAQDSQIGELNPGGVAQTNSDIESRLDMLVKMKAEHNSPQVSPTKS